MAWSGPPAYAWDWFARQRLLWRETRSRLAVAGEPATARRYASVETRTDVVPMLRADYPRDPLVRDVVNIVVAELAFLDRIDGRFEDLGLRNPPRGLRWWWSALTGEEPQAPAAAPPDPPVQLALDEVLRGYGDPPSP
ncbi:hypothetical protein [Egicoccus halophilus]|uniref:Uncharacterized protein n=1 Tax=Egicoccus halophilus TaxID=1670830 RepID=A0A8J3ADZ3_9ACTN|nr:hypothetical protein [Egicoccus halophilus]GGI05166.1 hypothetical protein GCM10011354_12740 [Egicoccus halophilus]